MTKSFNPNSLTFDEGISRIEEANSGVGYDFKSKITTSQESGVKDALEKLLVSNLPDGFKKFHLPVYLDGPSQLFVSIGEPDTRVSEHSHNEGDGFRYIVSGSIIFKGKELRSGDWMFIPAGMRYKFDVGPQGATMMYCYQCCCA